VLRLVYLPQANDELLGAEEVAQHLGVDHITVQRWCRDGELPCTRIGRSWGIRRGALEAFLKRSERSNTLAGKLRDFLEMPDNVLAIAQHRQLMRELDVAFFKVGDARGGTLAKYYDERMESAEELRSCFEREGLELARLEEEGRFRLVAQDTLEGDRTEALRRLMHEEGSKGRSIWANFNLNEQVDLGAALRQQEQLARFVEDKALVVKTSTLESVSEEWPGSLFRRAQLIHTGTLWLSESGLAFRRLLRTPTS
jgi:excisionase family DNA binding protein